MTTDAVVNGENFHLENGHEDLVCPSCDTKIKLSEVADHCQLEMQRLHSMQLRSSTFNAEAADSASAANTTTSSQSSDAGNGRRKPWSVFQRVQRNRQARLRQRTRKRPASSAPSTAASSVTVSASEPSTCPICNKQFPQTEIQAHANRCMSNSNGDEYHSSDEDGDSDEYEEYEWAGQKRIRVSTLVQGGYSALNLSQTVKYNGNQQQANDEEDEDLNVDEDDTHIYGPTQYGESDVIPLVNEDTGDDVSNYVRRLISSSDTSTNANHSNETSTSQQSTATATVEECTESAPSTSTSISQAASTSRNSCTSSNSTNISKVATVQNQQQIIDSLKNKLRHFEKQAQSNFKCLICIDEYKNPAISVSCWHVHCEQCWLRTLGARKLCPQCNSITTPKDLRRIYL